MSFRLPPAIKSACAVALVSLLAINAVAQKRASTRPSTEPQSAAAAVKSDEIRGIVTSADGGPLPLIFLRLFPAGKFENEDPRNTVPVQRDGSFRFSGVEPGVYWLHSFYRGYYLRPEVESSDTFQRPGAFVKLRLVRGGAITGTVLDAGGAPVVNVDVRAVRVRDRRGFKPPLVESSNAARTDDRGVYRIFGLSTGSYWVGVGSILGTLSNSFPASDVLSGAPTFYSSKPAEDASEVRVTEGQETNGIDIRIGTARGHTVAGRIVNPFGTVPSVTYGGQVRVYRLSDGLAVADHYVMNSDGTFSIGNVPNGEYVAIASRYTAKGPASSGPTTIQVKGADVRNLNLELALHGSVAGRVQFGDPKHVSSLSGCSAEPAPPLEQFAVYLRPRPSAEPESVLPTPPGVMLIDHDGKFQSESLRPGNYSWMFSFPDHRYYARSVSRTGPDGAPIDLGKTELVVATGEALKDVSVTIANGAAALSGRVQPALKGGKSKMYGRLYLLPAEPENAEDLLRFRDVEIGDDGNFAVANLAPGRYLLLAELLSADAPIDPNRTPTAWDAAARAKLRRAAESANTIVELKPCQRLTDYVFRFTPIPAK